MGPGISDATNSKASSGIGAVTITENDGAEFTNGTQAAGWDVIVGAGDGTIAESGTLSTFGLVNGVASSEDIFTIDFNDLGVGTRVVTLYMAHSATNRVFTANLDLVSSNGNSSETLTSSQIGGSGGSTFFSFTTEIDATDASDDLSINIVSDNGSSGQFAFAGYTVAVPEPSAFPLLAGLFGLIWLMLRRRV